MVSNHHFYTQLTHCFQIVMYQTRRAVLILSFCPTLMLLRTCTQDLHDRALLYYRLLQCDPAAASDVINHISSSSSSTSKTSTAFAEERDTTVQDAVFAEFNTLAVVYGEASDAFTQPRYRVKRCSPAVWHSAEDKLAQELSDLGVSPPLQPTSSSSTTTGTVGNLLSGTAASGGAAASPPHQQQQQQQQQQQSQQLIDSVDLLGMHDDSSTNNSSTAAAVHANGSSSSSSSELVLGQGAVLASGDFQQLWGQLGDGVLTEAVLNTVPAHTAAVEAAAARCSLRTMASGDKPDTLRFFFYGQGSTGAAALTGTHLMQCTVYKATRRLEVLVKSTASDAAAAGRAVADVLKTALGAV
jgi:Beta2-adaptin appendage, C-terminal sub-domain